jgi:hypothetical protein
MDNLAMSRLATVATIAQFRAQTVIVLHKSQAYPKLRHFLLKRKYLTLKSLATALLWSLRHCWKSNGVPKEHKAEPLHHNNAEASFIEITMLVMYLAAAAQ